VRREYLRAPAKEPGRESPAHGAPALDSSAASRTGLERQARRASRSPRISYNPLALREGSGKPRQAPLGEVAERLNAAVSKTVVPRKRYRGFESPPLRFRKPRIVCRDPVPRAGFSRLRGEFGGKSVANSAAGNGT
jgi:hypothetical protein